MDNQLNLKDESCQIVVLGAGQAGFQTCSGLRQAGFQGKIILIGDEPQLPYQRPPLSKAFFKDGNADKLLFRNADYFAKNNIDIRLNLRAEKINRDVRSVSLSNGENIHYDHLILALGARNRQLPIEGANLEGVIGLRSLHDANIMRNMAHESVHIVVIGGGFIGLEAASVFRAMGLKVTLLEAGSRLMGRAVTPPVSEYYYNAHTENGATIRLNAQVQKIYANDHGHVGGVELKNGERIDACFVLMAAGVVPNVEIAKDAGIDVANGIIVDRFMTTSDPHISAIGDCAACPLDENEAPMRLESVQVAVDQAKCLVDHLMGQSKPYKKTPWFWSDQGAHKLQIAGLSIGAERFEVEGSIQDHKLIVRSFVGDRQISVETVNAPAIHMAARREMDAQLSI